MNRHDAGQRHSLIDEHAAAMGVHRANDVAAQLSILAVGAHLPRYLLDLTFTRLNEARDLLDAELAKLIPEISPAPATLAHSATAAANTEDLRHALISTAPGIDADPAQGNSPADWENCVSAGPALNECASVPATNEDEPWLDPVPCVEDDLPCPDCDDGYVISRGTGPLGADERVGCQTCHGYLR